MALTKTGIGNVSEFKLKLQNVIRNLKELEAIEQRAGPTGEEVGVLVAKSDALLTQLEKTPIAKFGKNIAKRKRKRQAKKLKNSKTHKRDSKPVEVRHAKIPSTSLRGAIQSKNRNSAIEEQWKDVLFSHNNFDGFKQDDEDLVRKRRIWDSYLTSDKQRGSSIPIGWVLPTELPDDHWLAYRYV